jgi:1,4-dihydroxy-2-naphthoate octaprenyltransferase
MIREIGHFILHLRLHYQFLLLSGGYLLGGLLAGSMDTIQFWTQFMNVHILLFGGATAFNSYWDKDEGPIGGLKHPPKMTNWMHPVSLAFMIAGWVWSLQVSWIYFMIYGVSLILFWLYSTPLARWKGHPVLSLIAISLSTGFNSVLMGTVAAGSEVNLTVLTAAAGASLILLSLYPVSQIYQVDEDKKRGDHTFALTFGISGVKMFYHISYFTGLLLLWYGLYTLYLIPALVLGGVALVSGIFIGKKIVGLSGSKNEYDIVMKLKFAASMSFVLFLFISNMIRHNWIHSELLKSFF